MVEFKPYNITLIDDDCEPYFEFLDPNFNDMRQMHPVMIPEMARLQQKKPSLMGVVT